MVTNDHHRIKTKKAGEYSQEDSKSYHCLLKRWNNPLFVNYLILWTIMISSFMEGAIRPLWVATIVVL